jgi:hypothetical protein
VQIYVIWDNPLKYTDPDGNYIESAWDIASLVTGTASLVANIKKGDVFGIVVDSVGIALDTAAVILPGVPGGVGVAIKALRVAHDVAETAENIMTTAEGISEGNALKTAEGIAGIVSMGSSKISGKGFDKAAEFAKDFYTKYEDIGNIAGGAATLIDSAIAAHDNVKAFTDDK